MKPSQLSQLLTCTIAAKAPVLITGAPGIGKSDIVAQAASKLLRYSADALRANPDLREETARDAAAILKAMEGLY